MQRGRTHAEAIDEGAVGAVEIDNPGRVALIDFQARVKSRDGRMHDAHGDIGRAAERLVALDRDRPLGRQEREGVTTLSGSTRDMGLKFVVPLGSAHCVEANTQPPCAGLPRATRDEAGPCDISVTGCNLDVAVRAELIGESTVQRAFPSRHGG